MHEKRGQAAVQEPHEGRRGSPGRGSAKIGQKPEMDTREPDGVGGKTIMNVLRQGGQAIRPIKELSMGGGKKKGGKIAAERHLWFSPRLPYWER